VPVDRYRAILRMRDGKNWDSIKTRENLIPHFSPHFQTLKKRAGILKDVTFHDLRSPALSGWCNNGMEINDVKNLAGHSSIVTIQEFYLAVTSDLVDRARTVKSQIQGAILSHTPIMDKRAPKKRSVTPCKSITYEWAGADLNRRHTDFQFETLRIGFCKSFNFDHL